MRKDTVLYLMIAASLAISWLFLAHYIMPPVTKSGALNTGTPMTGLLIIIVAMIFLSMCLHISAEAVEKYSFEGTITKLINAGVCETRTQIMGDLPLVDIFFDDGTKMTATTVRDVGIITDRKEYWNLEEGKRYSLVYGRPNNPCFNKNGIVVINKLDTKKDCGET